MNSKIIEEINNLKKDDIHGASWLSLQAISTLSLAANQSSASTISDFINEIKDVAEQIVSARPNITPIANYANQVLHQILARSQSEKDVEAMKRLVEIKAKELSKSATKAFSRTVEYASGIITDLDTIITCSYSSTVCQVLELASQRETRCRVIVAESKFNDKSYGEITARQLMKYPIPVEIISDGDIKLRISKADKALVGADSITKEGYFINGKPTLLLAQAARSKNIPFFVSCDTAKFAIPGYVAKSVELEPVFDMTPLDLVTGIITEKGTMLPSLVMSYIQEKAEAMAQLSVSEGD
jgi:translation initiation factor 2B subunit (eIF-2B alpha/beta/delta family)